MSQFYTNVLDEEINKFTRLAHEWWNPQGPLKSLHDINPLRLSFIQQHAILKGAAILDVGCGAGILTESLAQSEPQQIMGIDLAQISIQVAQEHAKKMQLAINYQVLSVEQLAQDNSACFDVITCMELLEHVPKPQSVIRSCRQLLAPQGLLFVSTINRNLKSYFQAIVVAEYILHIVPQHTHNYQLFITPAQLAQMGREEGLRLVDMQGFSYNPLTKKYFLTNKTDVNYMAVYTYD